jgi:hypothetical protein
MHWQGASPGFESKYNLLLLLGNSVMSMAFRITAGGEEYGFGIKQLSKTVLNICWPSVLYLFKLSQL